MATPFVIILQRLFFTYFQINWICGLKAHPVVLVPMTFWTTVARAVSATLVSVAARINPDDAVNVVLNSIVMTVSPARFSLYCSRTTVSCPTTAISPLHKLLTLEK